MNTIANIKQTVSSWAHGLPLPVRIYLFGSVLKGKPNPSDIDLAFEFSDTFYKNEQRESLSLSCEFQKIWENELSKLLKAEVSLHLSYSETKDLNEYLKEASLVIYDASDKED